MENYGKVLEYTQESLNAAGTSEQKYSAYSESIQAHLNNFISTWQEFINNMNASGTFNAVIDFGSKLINLLDLLLNKFQLMKVLAPASIFMLLLNPLSKLINNFAVLGNRANQFYKILSMGADSTGSVANKTKMLGEALAGLSTKQQISILNTTRLTEEEKVLILTNAGLTAAEARTALSTTAVGKAAAVASTEVGVLKNAFTGLKLAFMSNPIGIAIAAITTVVTLGTMAWQSYNQKIQETIDKGKELSESFKNFESENRSAIESVESLKEEFAELSIGVTDYGENISLSTENYQRYQEIVSQVLNYSPQLIDGYNKEGKAIANKNALIERSIELLKQEREQELQSYVNTDLVDIGLGKIEEIKQAYSDLTKFESEFISNSEGYSDISSIFMENLATDPDVQAKHRKLQEFLGLDYDYTDTTLFYNEKDDIQRNLEDIYKMMQENTDIFTKEDLAIFQKYLREKELMYSNYQKAQESFSELQYIPQIIDGYDDLSDASKNFISEYINTFKLGKDDGTKEIKDMITDIQVFTQGLVDSSDVVKNNINNLFSLDPERMSADSYKEEIENILDSIPTELMSDELKLALKVQFGITVVDEDGNEIDRESQMKEAILDKFSGLTEGDLTGLSYVELELLVNAEGVDDLTGSGLLQYIEKLKAVAASASGEIQDFNSIVSNFAEGFSNVESHYETLTSAVEEFNSYGKISADTLKSLTENDLLQYLQFTTDGLVLNSEELYNNANSLRTQAVEAVKASAYEQLLALSYNEVTETGADAEAAINSVANMALSSKEKFIEGSKGLITYAAAQAVVGKDSVKLEDQIRAIVDSANRAITMINNTGATAVSSVSSSAGSASNSVQDQLDNQKDAIEDLIDSFIKMFKQQLEDEKELLEAKKDAEDKRYEIVKSELEKEEKLKDRYFEDEKDRLEKLQKQDEDYYDDRMEALNSELDAYQKKIDKQKELLDAKKEEQEYEKDLEEKVKSVAEIESELAALQFDDSIEAQKKKIELSEELADRQDELNEFQSEHEYDLQQDALDKELSRFEELQEAKKEAIEQEQEMLDDYWERQLEALEEEQKIWKRNFEDRQDAEEENHNKIIEDLEAQIEAKQNAIDNEKQLRLDALNAIDTKNQELYQKLIEWNYTYGTGVKNDITSAWNIAQNALQQYNDKCKNTQELLELLSSGIATIESNINSATSAMQNFNQELSNSAGSSGISKPVLVDRFQPTLSKNHTGDDYVTANADERKMSKALGLQSDEVVRILKVGEAVIPKEENIKRLSNNSLLGQNIISRTNEISKNYQSYSNDNSSRLNISIGDTIINGEFDGTVISKLNEYKKSIVNEIFSRINKHTNLSGFRNSRNFV